MKIRFGNIKIKVANGKYLKRFSSMENLFKVMFSKSNQNFFHELYKEILQSLTDYFEEFKKPVGKYTKRMN